MPEEKKEKPRRLHFRKILFIAVISITSVFIIVVLLSYVFSNRVKQWVVEALNQNIDTEVQVRTIDFSLLSNFPYASVDFKEVLVREAKSFDSQDTLLAAEKFSVLLNVIDLIAGKYDLKKIILENGSLYLKINKDGNSNYRIWKNDSSSTANTFKSDIAKVLLSNIDVIYRSDRSRQDYFFRVKKGEMKLSINGNKTQVISEADVFVKRILSEGVNFVKNKTAGMHFTLNYDSEKDAFHFKDSRVKIAGLDLIVNGSIISPEDYSEYNLVIHSENAGLKELLTVIPDEYTRRLDDYAWSGKVHFNLVVKGRSDKRQNPVFTIDFGTNSASIKPRTSPVALHDVKFTGFYTSRKSDNRPVSFLQFKNAYAILGKNKISGNLSFENLDNPLLVFDIDMDADLKDLSKFIKPDTLEFIDGNAELRNIRFTGNTSNVKTYVSSGRVVLKNVNLKFKNKPAVIKNVESDLLLDKNNLKINSLSGNMAQSDFAFTGMFTNFFGYLFGQNQKLEMNVTLMSSVLNLNEILEKDYESKNDTVYRIRFAENLSFNMQAHIEKLQFNKFSASAVHGNIKLNNGALTTEKLEFNAMDGTISLQGVIREQSHDSLMMQYDAAIKSIDITKLFYQMGNFGQQVMMDKNLKGNVTATIQFSSKWSSSLQCNYGSVMAASGITIENGELNNFSSMLALSKYVKGSDLNNIRFSTLKNTIEIKDRTIFIPKMEINSSALNIIASGTHTFDNAIDYKLQLLLSQIMGKKVKNLNTEFGTIEDDNLGRTRLFISMKGQANNPKFSYDSKGVKEKIADDIKNERQTLKEILKKEFGKGNSTDSATKKTEKKQELELESDGEE